MTKNKLPKYVYHLVEEANWKSVQTHGLLCANQLIDLAGYKTTETLNLQQQHRSSHTILKNGVNIRDQKPMPPVALKNCLVNMSPEEWYHFINDHIFFWLDLERLNRQRAACLPREQKILTIDTASFVAAYQNNMYLTPINTGYALRKAALRGKATFVDYKDWLETGWQKEAEGLGTTLRKYNHAPAELTVRTDIPDVFQFVVHVD
jgi:hypothetical protein